MRPIGVLAAGLLLLQGCAGQLAQTTGTSTPAPDLDTLSGSQVGRMAEKQLEEMHPGMAPGTMTCPDLTFDLGSSVRCEQVAELSAGRRIRVLGTVTVTSTSDGGSLHVKLDDAVVEFGITARHLTDQLVDLLPARVRSAAVARCPYLPGIVKHRVRCTVTVAKARFPVPVVVTSVDPATNSTRYRFDVRALDGGLKRSLPYVATKPSAVVDYPRDRRAAA